MTNNADRAERELLTALSEADSVDNTPAGEANGYAARRRRRRVDDAFAAATVYALLAIADAVSSR